MADVTLKLNLPEKLAREAEQRGLLSPQAMEAMLRAALRAERVDELFSAMDRLSAVSGPPLNEEEVQKLIDEARDERRGGSAGRH